MLASIKLLVLAVILAEFTGLIQKKIVTGVEIYYLSDVGEALSGCTVVCSKSTLSAVNCTLDKSGRKR